ncbi:uncharacterized protein HMPREF1541_07062 [Cyphellophora europaea CBS 101466]|uniref:Major facilitator superfamily (MFS) profile domain-containing protein n=1 Tax=Cyphellophora europaea (strain CBS 101466) TaxID=1220924 RepID=W2RRS9_CYPE1|nr:uncharacterized protein HMPREF1541_07062 [Cyphellophora europaea CBS 101466]ETN39020.1 hypothetical protein HMPREF1541_07062 [Cyphellophora europaea CBS 101466]
MESEQRASALPEEKAPLSSTSNTPSSRLSTSNTHDDHPSENKDAEVGIKPTLTEADKEAAAQPDPDPNVVTWDGLDDPNRPQNWTARKKWFNMSIVSAICFLTPLASSMVAPGIPLIMRDFNLSNETIGSFIVSIYVLGYAVGPLFIAPLSEVYGRLPVYHTCNFFFFIWTLACALAPNVGGLLAFRLLAGLAGSCPITIGGGSIADLFSQSERGAAMALFALGPLFGPVIGPVAGGYLSQAAGWRWVFWVLTIAGGVATVSALLLMRETFEPVLLERRTRKLRKETGNPDLRSKLDSGITKKEFFIRAIVRPTKMLIFSPTILIFSIYMAIVYGYLYLLFTTLTLVFESQYHFDQGSIGLTFLGIGVGSLLGLGIFGSLSDKLMKRLTAKHGGEMKPEYRLPPLIPASCFIPIGLFWYGWSAEKKVHWIMPIIGTGWVGLGLIAMFMSIQTYFVDCFTVYAASAIAANTVLRSLMGAFLPLAGPKMYRTLGLGWGNSLLGFVALSMVPVTFIFYWKGEYIRKHPRFQVKL